MLGDHMVEKRNLAGNGQEKIRENGFKISLRSSDQCQYNNYTYDK